MPDYLGDDQRKTKEEDKDDGPIRGESPVKKPEMDAFADKEAWLAFSLARTRWSLL